MSNVILNAVPYVALWLAATTHVSGTSTNLTVMLQNQAERATPDSHKSAVYTNKKYSFRFFLPESWRGYSIVAGEWEGGDGRSYEPGEAIPPPVKGPLISIRHPLWTESDPRQDIPVMIFTKAQWRLIEGGKLIVSAAPIGPGELGRNLKYVFALPPRFDIAPMTGSEEVGKMIQHHPLRPF
jgi:hypothetical protein